MPKPLEWIDIDGCASKRKVERPRFFQRFLFLLFSGLAAMSVKIAPATSESSTGVLQSVLLYGDTHVTPEATFPTIALVLTNAAFRADASILTALAWTLTIAAFLTLSAALTAWFRGQVFFISTKMMLEIQGGGDRILRDCDASEVGDIGALEALESEDVFNFLGGFGLCLPDFDIFLGALPLRTFCRPVEPPLVGT